MLVTALSMLLLALPKASAIPARPVISGTTGGLRAEVHDAHDAPVPGVRVLLSNADGQSWVAFTNEKGTFLAGDLPPGDYQLELAKGKHTAATHPKVVIKANAWLLGVAPAQPGAKAGPLPLTLVGPASYDYPNLVLNPKARPKIEKIPMH